MKKTILITAAALLVAPMAASAQEGTAAGVAGGAATGAVLGGPVGAVVGGIAGGVVGTAIAPPPAPVRSYIVEQPVSSSVRVEERIVVGQPLPEVVEIVRVPSDERYAYAVVNDRRVIVEPRTRRVIEVID